jgi:DNA sulfur modification protein DndD
MKLLSVKIENFRLLKDIKIDFSTDTDKNLTVVRAANGSGKTTLLHALQWGLYGNEGLPNGGKEFRKSPHKEDLNKTTDHCTIKVEISYETISLQGLRKYQLIRTSTEKISGVDYKETNSNVQLYYESNDGYKEEEHPDATISHDLSKDLREVFFTDGDSALRFIQGKKNEPMERVEGAIRSLLGLNLYENVITHTKNIITDLNKKVKDSYGDKDDIKVLSNLIEEYQKLCNYDEMQLKDAHIKLEKSAGLLEDTENKISDALIKGNKEKLDIELKGVKEDIDYCMLEIKETNKKLSYLFKEEVLAKHFLRDKFEQAKIILDNLHQKGEIPSQTVPVLKERLEVGSCICGESLELHDHSAKDRRDRIEQLIKESNKPDKTKENLTDLYYTSKNLLEPIDSDEENWPKIHETLWKLREKTSEKAYKKGKRQTELEQEIAGIPDVDIQSLRQYKDKYSQDKNTAQLATLQYKSTLEERRKKIKDIEFQRNGFLRDNNKGKQLYSEINVSKDLQSIFESSIETMKTTELQKVSELMNNLFLQMIGSGNDEQTDIITSAKIDENYSILVYGKLKQIIHPERDLNGASRRALTIAFILALTQVSKAVAPSVIDTPLGMMSGYVKQMTLKLASHQSSQLILFLTHSEIKDCEGIIDELAGRVYTFTNTESYPAIIKNKPDVKDSRILQCSCSHLEDCELCELTKSVQNAINKKLSLKEFFKWSKNNA